MPTLTIKNIPDILYEQLNRQAEANHRSINNEVIVRLEKTLGCRKANVEEILEEARRLRELTANHPISERELDEAKRSGRLGSL